MKLYYCPDPGSARRFAAEVPDDIGPDIACGAFCPCTGTDPHQPEKPYRTIIAVDLARMTYTCASGVDRRGHAMPRRWYEVEHEGGRTAAVAMLGGHRVGQYEFQELAPCVQVSTFADWDAFSRWYWNLIRKQFELSPEMRASTSRST